MSKIFIKVSNEKYEKVDKVTGEVTELKQTLVFDEESWFRLYSGVFCSILSDIKSLVDVKVFAVCLLASVNDSSYGNIVETGPRFKSILSKYMSISQPALSRSLKSLTAAGLLNKISTSYYQIHPQVAYCGEQHRRAKLILNLATRQ